jgi:hypothetical protein
MAEWVPVATKIVHFTGYEVQFDQIRLDDHRDRKLGHLIGTGDLIAQMADRCYLEKCRDRPLSRVRARRHRDAERRSRQDPGALQLRARRAATDAGVRRRRAPHAAWTASSAPPIAISNRCSTAAIPYMEAIERNLDYLGEVLRTGRWPMLRRDPPCFTWERNPVQNIRSLVIGHLKQVWKSG